MKTLIALLALLLFIAPALSSEDSAGKIEAITAISLPVDAVTIYPDGLVTMKRCGSMDITVGVHDFAVDVPWSASEDSILLWVSNATIERILYESIPVFTINVSSSGEQDFVLSYLMYDSGYWSPKYSLHLGDDTLLISAFANVENYCDEDLENVKLKLVSGLTPVVERDLLYDIFEEIAYEFAYAEEEKAVPSAPYYYDADEPATGELETLFIFELDGRQDLEMDSEVGLPLFEDTIPIERVYTWDAYHRTEGPVVEEIKANNTMDVPWPSGKALLYRNGEYVSTINIPYTSTGTEASIVVGPSADLTVSRELKDYKVEEKFLNLTDNSTNVVKETTKTWIYQLKIESNVDKSVDVEVTDTVPMEAEVIDISPEPSETTATSLKWELGIEAREESLINYTYQIVTTGDVISNKMVQLQNK
jgi:hypothetical protein